MDYPLPPGFTFEPYVDGPCLRLDGEMLACACPANSDPGARWRLCLSPRRPPRYEFLADEEACRRYMAAWAKRWEAEIRERCRGRTSGWEHLVRSDGPAPEGRHPRPRSRRGTKLL